MAKDQTPIAADALTILAANKAKWQDLQAIFGQRGQTAHCMCQHYKVRASDWWELPREVRPHMLREQTQCDHPRARHTTGLVAYLDTEPVGWCAVEPRPAYLRYLDKTTPWEGRDEDPADDGVWAVACFVVRIGYRGRRITYALAQAAVEHARARGARALEGYPMLPKPGQNISWGEMNVGSRGAFESAGMQLVHHPFPRRAVMRIDFK